MTELQVPKESSTASPSISFLIWADDSDDWDWAEWTETE